MNVMLIIKYSFTVMQGKRKLCECHTRFFDNGRKLLMEKKSSNSAFIADFWTRMMKKFLEGTQSTKS